MELDTLDDKQRLQDLKDFLHKFSAPAADALIERKEDGAVQCFACGHRCLIKPGRDGVCRVRFNDNGTLLVPHGYVGALACDPIEKKPFFHVLPGSDALTFGMLGCDYHCGYCFPGDTVVITDRGPATLFNAFAGVERVEAMPDGFIGLPKDLRVVAGSGMLRKVRAVFKHTYQGQMAVLRPYYLPELRCTADHRIYATDNPAREPQPIPARELTPRHYLAIPRPRELAGPDRAIDVHRQLVGREVMHRVRWKLSPDDRQLVAVQTAAGHTSRQIGDAIGKSASYVRHVRSKLAGGGGTDSCTHTLLLEEPHVRFPHERRPGLPRTIPLDTGMAELLGYYCAEGSVVRSAGRPNSYVLNFSFGTSEKGLAERTCELLTRSLAVKPRFVHRDTTIAVAVGKNSAALLFESLCGSKARGKRVPEAIMRGSDRVARAFVDAYISGDGHRYANGKVSATTVSRELAWGIAMLALRLGWMPSLYDHRMKPTYVIQGRTVRRSARQYTVVWHESPLEGRRVIEREHMYLVPLREVGTESFEGDVYNLEVEQEHNYLAGMFLVSNCQNWVTSQMLRDRDAVSSPREVTPAHLVEMAIQHGAPVVASSYNEPLITSEWAMDVFKAARGRGLRCAYISNGNGTPQVLDFLRPLVDAYKVDLKTFNPKNYRQLGGVLENVMATIKMLKERGFWVEIVTLVVPSFSDDADDLKRMADFLASIDPLMPWHMTAFHPDYKMTDGYRATTAEDLLKIVEFGRQAGLKYIYPGNLPGQVGEMENTRCHNCGTTLIKRWGFLVRENRMAAEGLCPDCRTPIPGIWGRAGGHRDGRVRPLL